MVYPEHFHLRAATINPSEGPSRQTPENIGLPLRPRHNQDFLSLLVRISFHGREMLTSGPSDQVKSRLSYRIIWIERLCGQ